jgi:hypothetical protein
VMDPVMLWSSSSFSPSRFSNERFDLAFPTVADYMRRVSADSLWGYQRLADGAFGWVGLRSPAYAFTPYAVCFGSSNRQASWPPAHCWPLPAVPLTLLSGEGCSAVDFGTTSCHYGHHNPVTNPEPVDRDTHHVPFPGK